MTKANNWGRVFAGFYRFTGADAQTVLASVSREENGTWTYTVLPFGQAGLSWQITGQRTLAEAKRGAEAGYRSWVTKHKAVNA